VALALASLRRVHMVKHPRSSRAPKLARFLVACSVDKVWKEDALGTFDERYEVMVEEFGINFAQWWAWQQAVRSIPYRSYWFIGPVTGAVGTILWRIVS
jgi:hypothetical protein